MRPHVRRPLSRVAVVAFAFLLGSVGSIAAWAQAKTEDIGMSQTGYYTRQGDPSKTISDNGTIVTCQIPAPPPNPAPFPPSPAPPNPNCVATGPLTGSTGFLNRKDNYLYAAKINNEDHSYGFVAVDLASLPFGSTLSSLEFIFEVENEVEVGTTTAAFVKATPRLRLCMATSEWVGGDAGAWDLKPTLSPTVCSDPVYKGDAERSAPDPADPTTRTVHIYSVDLMNMASVWASGKDNFGFSIQPTTDAPAEYQVAIRGPGVAQGAMLAKITYEAPPPDASFGLGVDEGSLEDPSIASFGSAFSEESSEVVDQPFSVDPAAASGAGGGPIRAAGASTPRTPWYVWLVLPLGLAGLVLLGQAATAEVVAESGRIGSVGRLMRQRAGQGGRS